jgi:hypothetical protein
MQPCYLKLHFTRKRGKCERWRTGVAALPGASACKLWQLRAVVLKFSLGSLITWFSLGLAQIVVLCENFDTHLCLEHRHP